MRLLLSPAAAERLAKNPDQAARLFERLEAWRAASGNIIAGPEAALPDGHVHLLWRSDDGRTGELGIDRNGEVSS